MSITIVQFSDFVKKIILYFIILTKKIAPQSDVTWKFSHNRHKNLLILLIGSSHSERFIKFKFPIFQLNYPFGNNSCACDNCGSICQCDQSQVNFISSNFDRGINENAALSLFLKPSSVYRTITGGGYTARNRAHAAFAGVVVCPRRVCALELPLWIFGLCASVFADLVFRFCAFSTAALSALPGSSDRRTLVGGSSALISAAISGTLPLSRQWWLRYFRTMRDFFISYPNIFFFCLFYISSCVNFKIRRLIRFFLRSQQ